MNLFYKLPTPAALFCVLTNMLLWYKQEQCQIFMEEDSSVNKIGKHAKTYTDSAKEALLKPILS